ncbi:MAG: carboxylesterase family protein [Candidatus Eremiobacteraeota bacterium]|nr:carboxylesterase family protein [Candidatus Eremiobacteraeota bacterium]
MNRRSLRCATYAATLAAAALAFAFTGTHAGESAEVTSAVRIEGGTVSGTTTGGVDAFKGIPYAAPPLGELRWRAPAPPVPWPGVLAGADYGASCPQAAPPERVPDGSRAESRSEDCLTLNVWTPASHRKPLPVMVWLHGGGNTSGTGSQTFYDGTGFARDGVVLVTLNYRLGVLGFFAPAAIVREAGATATADFGLLDQIAALKWVRENVAAFGGDPSNVTLFGESAGGEDALILANSDAARGLFARAIVESAGDLWNRWPTLAEAQTRSALVAAKFGLEGDAATSVRLRALPASTLAGIGDEDQLGPIVDGHVVRAPLAQTLGRAVNVPVVIGTNDGDGSIAGGVTDPADLFPALTSADVSFVRARLNAAGISGDGPVASQFFGDGYFAAPARWVAETLAAAGKPAYLYRFDYVASFLSGRRRAATHGSEIPFVFDSWSPAVPLSDADRTVGADLHDCWVAFARAGVPDCGGVPHWPRYDVRDRRLMNFSARPSLQVPADTDIIDLLEQKLVPR